MRNVRLVKIEKPTETWEFNKKNILNQLFSYKKTYEFEFELEGGNEWGQKKVEFSIIRIFKGVGKLYLVNIDNRSFRSNNLQVAMLGALEDALIGYIKYNILKDKIEERF